MTLRTDFNDVTLVSEDTSWTFPVPRRHTVIFTYTSLLLFNFSCDHSKKKIFCDCDCCCGSSSNTCLIQDISAHKLFLSNKKLVQCQGHFIPALESSKILPNPYFLFSIQPCFASQWQTNSSSSFEHRCWLGWFVYLSQLLIRGRGTGAPNPG